MLAHGRWLGRQVDVDRFYLIFWRADNKPCAKDVPGLQLLGLAVVVALGMSLSAMLSARRLATLKVAETLRELRSKYT